MFRKSFTQTFPRYNLKIKEGDKFTSLRRYYFKVTLKENKGTTNK